MVFLTAKHVHSLYTWCPISWGISELCLLKFTSFCPRVHHNVQHRPSGSQSVLTCHHIENTAGAASTTCCIQRSVKCVCKKREWVTEDSHSHWPHYSIILSFVTPGAMKLGCDWKTLLTILHRATLRLRCCGRDTSPTDFRIPKTLASRDASHGSAVNIAAQPNRTKWYETTRCLTTTQISISLAQPITRLPTRASAQGIS